MMDWLYGFIYKPKEDVIEEDSMGIPTPGFISANALVSAQMQNAQNNYQQAMALNAQQISSLRSYAASAVQKTWSQAGTGTLGIQQLPNSVISLPAPTGNHFTIQFRDASGVSRLMVVDQAYLGIIQQISNMMQYYVPQGPLPWPVSSPAPVHTKMVDGEFSLDEMGQAEEIIMELDGAS